MRPGSESNHRPLDLCMSAYIVFKGGGGVGSVQALSKSKGYGSFFGFKGVIRVKIFHLKLL